MELKEIVENITENNEHPSRWDIKGYWLDNHMTEISVLDIAKKDFVIGDELFINSVTGEISKSGDVRIGIVEMEHPTKPYWFVNTGKFESKESLAKLVADSFSSK